MTEMQEYIPFDEHEKTEFYERFGSAFFKLQANVSKEYATHLIDIFFKSVSFAGTVVGTVGIIAGFGFTAFSFVESRTLFFIGEGLLLYSILHGLLWIQRVYKGEFDSLDKARGIHQKYFTERNEKFKAIWKKVSTDEKIEKQDFLSFMDFHSKAPELFAPPVDPPKEKRIFSKKLYYLMIAGSACLLSSFFIYSIVNFILCPSG